jgi:four helix bundle protein
MSTEKKKKYGPVFRFVNYHVYQDSKLWLREIQSMKGVIEANTELWSQLRGNSTSVVMNIAASSTKLPQEAKRYLGNSITAANKVVACLDIAVDAEAITAEEFEELSAGYKQIVILLKSFIKAIGRPRVAKEEDENVSTKPEPVMA